MNNNKPTTRLVFISAERPGMNDIQTHDAFERLVDEVIELGLSYKVVIGCYKGVKETTLCVGVTGGDDLIALRAIGTQFKQDSILYRDLEGDAYIIPCGVDSWHVDKIGQMVRITYLEAQKSGSWTYDLDTIQYWGVK